MKPMHLIAVALLLVIPGCSSEDSATPQRQPNSAHAETVAGADGTAWKAGTHYETVASPAPARAGRIEVLEFFWYGCSHCYTLEPHLVLWDRRKADGIDFVRVPVAWPSMLAEAQLFYTLEELGRGDLHQAVFDAIHRRGSRLSAPDDARRTLELQAAFAEAHGVSTGEFRRAYDSRAVKENVRRAVELSRQLEIDTVPSVIINGTYKTSLGNTNGHERDLIAVVDALCASELGS